MTMKGRRIGAVFAACLCALLLSGCGSSSNEVRYGFVTGPNGTSGDSVAADIAAGMESYASSNSMSAKYYMASEETNDAYAEAFSAAADENVRYVITVGEDMEVPVYEAQNAHHKSKYVLIGGEPRKSSEYEASIRSNTECVIVNRQTQGFLAGYAVVKMNYTSFTWLTGPETAEDAEYYEGFLNGAAYAVQEMGLSADSLTINVEHAASDAFSPSRYADALRFYNEGCEIIVTDRPELAKAAEMAADEWGTYVATVGFDATGDSDRVLFSSVPNYSGAIESIMQSFDESKGFAGGTVLEITAKQNGVKLAGDYSRMTSYAESDTQKIISAMADGTAVVMDVEGKGDEAGQVGLGYTLTVTQREAARSGEARSSTSSGSSGESSSSGTVAGIGGSSDTSGDTDTSDDGAYDEDASDDGDENEDDGENYDDGDNSDENYDEDYSDDEE